MPLPRRRHEDGGTKYRMREKLFAIGDGYWIEDENGAATARIEQLASV